MAAALSGVRARSVAIPGNIITGEPGHAAFGCVSSAAFRVLSAHRRLSSFALSLSLVHPRLPTLPSRLHFVCSPSLGSTFCLQTNGSALRSSYWATIEGGGAIGTACASGALPVPFEGIQWDWLNTPTPGEDGLTFLGNETVTLPLTPPQQVLAAHWQSASTCQDMWLVPMATPPGAPPGLPYSAPVLYTLADASSAPSCDHNNRTFAFTYVESHTAAEYANDSPVFTLPPPCIALLGPEGNGRGGSSAGGGSSTDGPGIPVVWVTVASALAAVLGAVVGFVVFRKVAVARLRRRGGGGGGRSGRGEGGGIGIGGGGLGGGVGRGGGGGWDLPDDGPRGAGGGYLQPLMDGF